MGNRLGSLLFCFLFIESLTLGQGHSDLVKIDLTGKSISDLIKSGLAFDHGFYEKGNSFIGDFSSKEILKLEQLGFKVEAVEEEHILTNRTFKCNSDTAVKPFYPIPSNYSIGSMNGFLNLYDLYDNLDLMHELYPNLITKRNRIGNFSTEEGQSLFYLKISDNPNQDEFEPEVLYTALHHAREPASMSQMLFFMWYLLENYDKDISIKKLVDSRQLYFVPCLNPDGYRYNETTNPSGFGFWRKNRTKNEIGYGVDLNRNYGYQWGFNDIGSSNNSEMETYRGQIEFSESETQAIKDLCKKHNFKIALNYHTFGNFLLIPWGYSDSLTSDKDQFFALAKEFTKYNNFLIGTATSTLNYQVNGVSDDWMYGDTVSKNKIFAFTPEIGESFWPDRSEISRINRSCQFMNISAAWNAGSVATIKDVSTETIEPINGKLQLLVGRTGLQNADIIISCTSNFPNQIIITNPQTFRLNSTEEKIVEIEYKVNSILSKDSKIIFTVKIETGDYSETINFEKKYLGLPYWKDECNNLDYWESPFNKFLAVSNEDYTSPLSAFTDSPNSNDLEDKSFLMNTKDPIDLINSTYAYLSYKVKYDLDIEKDYAQILISTDGNKFFPVCGKNSILGGILQGLDQPIYSGFQGNWISDWVDLSEFIGNKIYLQIKVGTSSTVEKHDGILLDDLKIYTDLISKNKEIQSNEFLIYPIPATDEIIVEDKSNNTTHIVLLNAQGVTQKSEFYKIGNSWKTDISGLSNGLYYVTCYNNKRQLRTVKVIIQ